uniref:SFRICE_001924 n=1 Tax=Spodoptera frugiperda TaxID=7108 RepID=A0A2H1W2H9_SPOFR
MALDRILSRPFYVTSRRGNPMIIYEGKNFIKERARGSQIRWVCGKKRRLQCIATVTTFEGEVVKTYGFHNHS